MASHTVRLRVVAFLDLEICSTQSKAGLLGKRDEVQRVSVCADTDVFDISFSFLKPEHRAHP